MSVTGNQRQWQSYNMFIDFNLSNIEMSFRLPFIFQPTTRAFTVTFFCLSILRRETLLSNNPVLLTDSFTCFACYYH